MVGFVCCTLEVVKKRLTEDERSEMIHLYEVKGMSVAEIARQMSRHHSTVAFWLKDIIKSVPVQARKKYVLKYDDYLEQEELRRAQRRMECCHPQTRLVVICLGCGEHLEKTKTHEAMVKVDFL